MPQTTVYANMYANMSLSVIYFFINLLKSVSFLVYYLMTTIQ